MPNYASSFLKRWDLKKASGESNEFAIGTAISGRTCPGY